LGKEDAMMRRHAFRPMAWDALEERQLLSHGSVVTVGTLGDSYSDEYRFYPPDQSQARNWVEILAANRAVSFGPFTTASRGEPRNQGFAYNWARFGATSGDMVRNQLPGLTAQVAHGKIDDAWIFVGGNDFLYFLRGVQTGQIPASQALTTLTQVEAQAEANIRTAVGTLLAANPNVRLVLVTVPDVAELPIVRAGIANPIDLAAVNATSQAIQQLNASIVADAAVSPRIALVDLAGQSALLAQVPGGLAPFGGTVIDTVNPGDDFHHFFLADGTHVGTVAQGIIADDFLAAIDSHFGARVPLLTPTQIVAIAQQVQARTHRGG
jgi:hypothetical protein